MDNPLPMSRTALWEVIDNYARVCGGKELTDLSLDGVIAAITSVESVIGDFESRALEFVLSLRNEADDLRRRLKEKEEALRDIGKACFLLKNTAHGDMFMFPGDLDLRVKEGLDK